MPMLFEVSLTYRDGFYYHAIERIYGMVVSADLALELPVLYATGSAEYFAAGAVTLLDRLGVVDSLCFWSFSFYCIRDYGAVSF